jgi:hypothetical protein
MSGKQHKRGDDIGGEYRVQAVFGGENESGMGVVYLVTNREIPYPIVLKTFQSNLSEAERSRFIVEAQAWTRLLPRPTNRSIIQHNRRSTGLTERMFRQPLLPEVLLRPHVLISALHLRLPVDRRLARCRHRVIGQPSVILLPLQVRRRSQLSTPLLHRTKYQPPTMKFLGLCNLNRNGSPD